MRLTVNLKESKNAQHIVRKVACDEYDMVETVSYEEDVVANLLWYERGIAASEVSLLRHKHQRVNMIPGMQDMARKLTLARVLGRLARLFPEEYKFSPRTWSLPLELDAFKHYCARKRNGMYIVKPSGGCQGAGIYLVTGPNELQKTKASAVVQEYVRTPLLLDGFKFDLRCYCLVLSVKPLVIYVYKDGMARFATHPYQPPDDTNMHDVFMHLTNYSLNKNNPDCAHARTFLLPPCGVSSELAFVSRSRRTRCRGRRRRRRGRRRQRQQQQCR